MHPIRSSLVLLGLSVALTTPAIAQLGRSPAPIVDPNVATDSAMLALKGITPPIVQALKDARPILSIVSLDSLLGAKSLTKPQRTELFAKMFVHVDVNRGSDAELMLIPGVDAAKLRAIKAGRPWKTFADFQAAVAKATPATEAARIEQYLFIPIALNSFTDEAFDTFASIGVGTRQWKREFREYRPWTTMEQFDREIGKYLRNRPTELKRLARYVIIDK
jgi:hypothetical protein